MQATRVCDCTHSSQPSVVLRRIRYLCLFWCRRLKDWRGTNVGTPSPPFSIALGVLKRLQNFEALQYPVQRARVLFLRASAGRESFELPKLLAALVCFSFEFFDQLIEICTHVGLRACQADAFWDYSEPEFVAR